MSEQPVTNFQIPTWNALTDQYADKWKEKKNKFWDQLKENLQALINSYRSGKQSVYKLTDGPYHQQYIQAFRELFSDTGYAATPGDWTRHATGATKTMELYISLPDCFSKQGL